MKEALMKSIHHNSKSGRITYAQILYTLGVALLLASCAAAPTPTMTPSQVAIIASETPANEVTLAPTRPPTQPPSATSPRPSATATATTTLTATPTLTRTPTAVVALPSTGSVLREYWFNIEGYTPDELRAAPRFPNRPDYCDQGSEVATTPDQGDNFGARIRGYLTPPNTGEYTFWIGSDNGSEFWLSSDNSADNLVKLLDFDSYANYLDFDGAPQQESEPVRLRAGNRYYFEALFQEDSSGFDWLAVAWQGPGIAERQVVSSAYLSSDGFPCALTAPPTRTPQP
jgi:hypothetical protein